MINFDQKIGFTPLIIMGDGHGDETAGKRTPPFPDGKVIKENQFNKPVVNLMEKDAKRLGFKTFQVAPEDYDVPLVTRSSRANTTYAKYKEELKAQGINLTGKVIAIYISIHFNALLGTWESKAEGIETHHYPGSVSGTRLAQCIQNHIKQGTPQIDRGIKASNFHVLRETVMPAALVEGGFMDNRREASLMLDENYQLEMATEVIKGACEFFGVEYIENDSSNETQTDSQSQQLTLIMGTTQATVEQMVSYALKGNPNPKLPNCTIEELAQIFVEEAEVEGVRADGAWAQTLKETGYFKYGGIVLLDQNNYSGIGALNDNKKGEAESFESPRIGARAQMQHLKAYGSTENLKLSCVDPRFHLVRRGSAKYFEWLGYKDNPNGAGWAWPGSGYGYDIIKILNGILKEPKTESQENDSVPKWQRDAFKKLVDNGVINTPETWADKLDKQITVGEVMGILANML